MPLEQCTAEQQSRGVVVAGPRQKCDGRADRLVVVAGVVQMSNTVQRRRHSVVRRLWRRGVRLSAGERRQQDQDQCRRRPPVGRSRLIQGKRFHINQFRRTLGTRLL